MSQDLIMLFVEGEPVVYELQTEENAFLFTPLSSWKDKSDAVTFVLQKINENWKVTGTGWPNADVIAQAVEELENRLS